MANINMRTTSSVESFNALLNRSMQKRPDFFNFVMALQIHESRKVDEMFYVAKNPTPDEFFEKKKKQDKNRDKKIRNLTEMLNKNELSTEEFMRAMACDKNGKIIGLQANYLSIFPCIYPSIYAFI